MASGSPPIHGAQVPSPRWWRPFRNVPLIIVAVLSLAAAIIGWITTYRIDSANAVPAAVTATPGAIDLPVAVRDACRAPVALPASEPWIDDAQAAAEVWTANAANLANPVVLGRDGWAFYNDQVEENFSQAIGRRYLSAVEAEAWVEYFRPVAAALAERGVDFTIQISPSASSVYPEKLPEWTDPIIGSTPLDQLLIAGPDLPIVDFRADLRDAADDNAVFSPVNSHWTDWGGYIGWQTFARCDAALHPDAQPVFIPATDGVQITGEYNEYAQYGVPGLGPDWTAPVFAEALAPVQLTDNTGEVSVVDGATAVDLSRVPASTVTDGSRSDRTALILRDSMGNALSPYWAQEYAQTWQIAHRYDDWSNPPDFAALVDDYQPDVVIVQLAERHLVNAPPVPSGY